MSTVAPEPVACPTRWSPHYGTMSTPAAAVTAEPFCEEASVGAGGEGYAWQTGCPRRYATAAAASTTAVWPNSCRSLSLAAAAATAAAASASSQFWMPPEDPWRWTRGAQPSSPAPQCATVAAPASTPPACHGATHDPMHRYCYGCNNHCSLANDWMNARTDNVYYGEAAPHLEPLIPASALQRSCSASRVPEKRLSCHQHETTTKRTVSADKECAAAHADVRVIPIESPCAAATAAQGGYVVPMQPQPPSMQCVGVSTTPTALHQRSPPQMLPRAMRSQVHYRRENTYHMGSVVGSQGVKGVRSECGSSSSNKERMRMAAAMGGGGGGGGNWGARGDGGMAGYAATMERVHHTTLQGETCLREGVSLRSAVSAEAVATSAGAVAAAGAASRAASRSASCGSSARSIVTRQVYDAGRNPVQEVYENMKTGGGATGAAAAATSSTMSVGRGPGSTGSGAGGGVGGGRLTTGITSNLSDYIWKPQEENAWELWYQKKKKEEKIRRRKEEKRKKIMEQQEAAKKEEESLKKELEEENRKKWLQRKKRQQEDEKKRLEEQKQLAEKKAQEEAEKHEMRVRHHLELLKKSNQRREEIRKEDVQRRELAQKQAEEAKRVRQEESARVLAEWKARAATKPRPLTGCIFNHDPQASVPKPALDFFNPEPWQF